MITRKITKRIRIVFKRIGIRKIVKRVGIIVKKGLRKIEKWKEQTKRIKRKVKWTSCRKGLIR